MQLLSTIPLPGKELSLYSFFPFFYYSYKKFPMMLMNATAIRKKMMDTVPYDPIMFLNIIYTSIVITITKVRLILGMTSTSIYVTRKRIYLFMADVKKNMK